MEEPEKTNQHAFNVDEGTTGKDHTLEELEIGVFRLDREGIRKVLGDLEAEIMEYIWECTANNEHGVTVREVYEAFRLRRIIAYTTILSTMTRLSKKRLLRVRKEEAAYVYTPVLSEASFIEKMVSSILENLLVSFSQITRSQVNRLVTPASIQRHAELKAAVHNLREITASQHMNAEYQTGVSHPKDREETDQ